MTLQQIEKNGETLWELTTEDGEVFLIHEEQMNNARKIESGSLKECNCAGCGKSMDLTVEAVLLGGGKIFCEECGENHDVEMGVEP